MSSKKYGSQFLKGLGNFRVAPGLESNAIRSYLMSLDCPRALSAWLLYESGEHGQLANLSFDPLHYRETDDVRDAYAATKFLSKFKGLTLNYDLDEVALKKFSEFETLCKQTNSRFKNLSADPQYKGAAVWVHHATIRKIRNILGEFCPSEFFEAADWGPGASTLIKRRDASAVVKFQNETGITRDLYSLLPPDLLVDAYPLWVRHLVKSAIFPTFQVGNKVITVAKDASTNRVIAIEPGINLWFQKSVGDMIERRLARVGIDLSDQGKNQQLAKSGSISGLLATVDLSSASDSISKSVVEELLPPRWYSVLDSCRSHYGLQRDTLLKWEKFSSMGNGFTFPLESLIFYAVASSCVEYLNSDIKTVSVYGDDVIIPTSCFVLFAEMMAFYGFRVNMKKSYFSSFFRESCGAHYMSGRDVKPVYLKDKLSTVLTVYRLANAFRRYAHRRGYFSCDAALRKPFELLVQSVPVALRLRIPESLGDGGFISNFDEATPSRAKHGLEGFRVNHALDASLSCEMDTEGYLLASLWSLAKRDLAIPPSLAPWLKFNQLNDGSYTLETNSKFSDLGSRGQERNSVPVHRTKLKMAVSVVRQWSDLGIWV